MKGKKDLIVALLQLIIGVLGVCAFFVVYFSDEPIGKWIVTLILSIAFAVFGVMGILDYKSKKG
jgi:uncharacterized membrane protein HdeD (DUF308 family)